MWLKHDTLIDTWDISCTDWFVVFEHGDMKYWWTKYLQGGFRHCWAFRWDGYNWIAYRPNLGYTDIEILPWGKLEDIEFIHKDIICSAIIRHKAWRKTSRLRAPFPTAFTCVEQVKALLGIRKWYMFTAYQLFNYLRKKNG